VARSCLKRSRSAASELHEVESGAGIREGSAVPASHSIAPASDTCREAKRSKKSKRSARVAEPAEVEEDTNAIPSTQEEAALDMRPAVSTAKDVNNVSSAGSDAKAEPIRGCDGAVKAIPTSESGGPLDHVVPAEAAVPADVADTTEAKAPIQAEQLHDSPSASLGGADPATQAEEALCKSTGGALSADVPEAALEASVPTGPQSVAEVEGVSEKATKALPDAAQLRDDAPLVPVEVQGSVEAAAADPAEDDSPETAALLQRQELAEVDVAAGAAAPVKIDTSVDQAVSADSVTAETPPDTEGGTLTLSAVCDTTAEATLHDVAENLASAALPVTPAEISVPARPAEDSDAPGGSAVEPAEPEALTPPASAVLPATSAETAVPVESAEPEVLKPEPMRPTEESEAPAGSAVDLARPEVVEFAASSPMTLMPAETTVPSRPAEEAGAVNREREPAEAVVEASAATDSANAAEVVACPSGEVPSGVAETTEAPLPAASQATTETTDVSQSMEPARSVGEAQQPQAPSDPPEATEAVAAMPLAGHDSAAEAQQPQAPSELPEATEVAAAKPLAGHDSAAEARLLTASPRTEAEAFAAAFREAAGPADIREGPASKESACLAQVAASTAVGVALWAPDPAEEAKAQTPTDRDRASEASAALGTAALGSAALPAEAAPAVETASAGEPAVHAQSQAPEEAMAQTPTDCDAAAPADPEDVSSKGAAAAAREASPQTVAPQDASQAAGPPALPGVTASGAARTPSAAEPVSAQPEAAVAAPAEAKAQTQTPTDRDTAAPANPGDVSSKGAEATPKLEEPSQTVQSKAAGEAVTHKRSSAPTSKDPPASEPTTAVGFTATPVANLPTGRARWTRLWRKTPSAQLGLP